LRKNERLIDEGNFIYFGRHLKYTIIVSLWK